MLTHQDAAQLSTPLHTIAVNAAIWGIPLASMDAMRQAFFRDARAQYQDILYWSKPADWRLQLKTPNASTHYAFVHFNTAAGPIVIETPPVVGADLFGSILDAWQVPAADVGPHGLDGGRGGRYLVLPPGFGAQAPDGYHVLHLDTFNGYGALRAIPDGASATDRENAIQLLKHVRVHPLAHPEQAQRFIDMAGRLFDGVVRLDASFYDRLARMVNEEPALVREGAMLRNLEALGIRKGAPFSPQRIRPLLDSAAADAHAWFMRRAESEGRRYWPGKAWRSASVVGARTQFTFEENGVIDIDARGAFYFLACAPPRNVGNASAYLAAFRDATDKPLTGDLTYRLRVPAHVPAKQFWAITVYDASTAAFLRNTPRVEASSYDQQLAHDANGSIDIWFGPQPVAGTEASWITTLPGTPWFAIFRFYGPDTALTDMTWQLPDIEPVSVTSPR